MFINNFDPVAFQIFSFEIRWYSLAYIFGIIFGWLYCKKKLIRDEKKELIKEIEALGEKPKIDTSDIDSDEEIIALKKQIQDIKDKR